MEGKSKRNDYYDNKVMMDCIPLKDGKRDTIVQWIYDIHVVEWCVTYWMRKRMTEDIVKDKVQDIYLMICEKTQEEWDELYAQGNYSIGAYVAGMCHKQIKSNKSYCYKKYDGYSKKFNLMDEKFWEEYYES